MPPILNLKDKFGNELNFGNAGDVWLPPFPWITKDWRQQVQDIRNIQLRPDDVILLGYPKTGSHWTHEIVHMLIDGSAKYHNSKGPEEFLEAAPQETIPPPDKPRVFFTHLRHHHLPKQVWEKKVKLIYMERNPKDTWVSFYNHIHGHNGIMGYNGTWEHFFELMMDMGHVYGDWFDFVLDWEKKMAEDSELTIMTSPFEELKKNPVEQIQKMNEFLGLNRSRELCEQIAEACNFTNMKAVKDAATPEETKKKMWKDNAAGFYRKGEIGDWKNWFTVAQKERFDAEYAKRMANSKLSYIYE